MKDNRKSLKATNNEATQKNLSKDLTKQKFAKDALLWRSRGYSVLPITVGKKTPAIKKWSDLQKQKMSEDEINRYFTKDIGVALIGGVVSNNAYFIDFDNKLGNAKSTLQNFTGDMEYVRLFKTIGSEPVIMSTPSGGFHMYLLLDHAPQGNLKFAMEYDENGKSYALIETRGEGGYIVAPPTKGYKYLYGEWHDLPVLTKAQSNILTNIAKKFDQKPLKKQLELSTSTKEGISSSTTPTRNNPWKKLFNENLSWQALNSLLRAGWEMSKDDGFGKIMLTRPGKDTKDGASASFGYGTGNTFYVFTSNDDLFEAENSYTPFEVVSILNFSGNHNNTLKWVKENFKDFPEAGNYIRVGNDHYKILNNPDYNGINRRLLTKRRDVYIKQDHSSLIFNYIEKYDAFTTEPDNINYQTSVGSYYNLYHQFSYSPKKGDCKYSLAFVKHIFEDQYELGLDYMTLLYKLPKQKLPILVLVSKERGTGKSTFLEWLLMIFGGNAKLIRSEDLSNKFNASYAHANIVMADEAFVDKTKVMEKLKFLATTPEVMYESKGIDQIPIPWFGKIILAGNREQDLVRIDDDEVRYWVRKIGIIEDEKLDPDFKGKLKGEIPAFIEYLSSREMSVQMKLSRHWFKPEMLTTKQLVSMKKDSKSSLFKDLSSDLLALMDEHEVDVLYATPKDIKALFYKNSNNIHSSYIIKVLKDEFDLLPASKTTAYWHMNVPKGISASFPENGVAPKMRGKPYTFRREDLEKLV